jgi:hypothetical protein
MFAVVPVEVTDTPHAGVCVVVVLLQLGTTAPTPTLSTAILLNATLPFDGYWEQEVNE